MNGKVLDKLIAALSTRKRFQVFILILLGFNYVPVVFNHVVMTFYKTTPKFVCKPVQVVHFNSNGSLAVSLNGRYTNNTHGENAYQFQGQNKTPSADDIGKCSAYKWYNESLGGENGNNTFNDGSFREEKCQPGQWVFAQEESTIVSEWDLVCDRSYLASLSTTIYFGGVMLGGLFFGFLSDRVGRLPILLLTLYASVAIGIATAFAPSYLLFVVLRFIQGALMQGLQTSSYVMAMEYFMPAQRPIVGAIMECFWGATVMVLAGLAYALPQWRHLQLAISIPSVLAVFYICVMPESLRWLILTRRIDRAERLVHRIAAFNHLPFPSTVWETVTGEAKALTSPRQQFNFLHLFKTPKLRRRSLVLFYIWLTIATGYFGLTFSITALRGNKYMNFFISGLVEFVHYVLSMWFMTRFGRKKPLLACFIGAGVCCIIAASFPRSYNTNVVTVYDSCATAFAIVGRFFVAGLFSVIFVYTSELYPTVIRNIGIGSCVFWARLGGVIAPQINQLGAGAVVFVPIMVFGAMMLVGGALLLFLPETHGTKLPDVIDDVERPDAEETGEKLIVQSTILNADPSTKLDRNDDNFKFERNRYDKQAGDCGLLTGDCDLKSDDCGQPTDGCGHQTDEC